MAWWKRKARVSDVRCEACQVVLAAGSAIPGIEKVYLTKHQTKVVQYLCMACWQRHLSLEADAEAQFRREHPVEEVCARLGDPDIAVRAEAARHLARLGDRQAVPDLCSALTREASPSEAFEEIAEALGAFGGAEARQALIAVLHDEKAWLRSDYGDDFGPSRVDMAAEALVTMGGSTLFVRAVLNTMTSSAAGPALKELVAHELSDIAYRYTADYGLTPWVDEELTNTDCELMVEPLRAALRDTNWQVREHAATALGDLGDTRAVEDLIGVLDDENHRVRYFAAQALGNLGDRRAIEPLRRALADNPDTTLTIKEALAKLTR